MSLWLAALLLPGAALAQAPQACKGADDLHLQEAFTKSQEITAACRKNGIMPASLAKTILDFDGSTKGPNVKCAYAFGPLARTMGDKALILVDLDRSKQRPESETSVRETRYLDETVFHELLHAADPKDARMYTNYAHNHAEGFPDAIYGCEYACTGNMDPPALGYLVAFEAVVKPIPACGKGDCPPLKKYEWLCKNGVMSLTEDEWWYYKMLAVAICINDNDKDIGSDNKVPLAAEILDGFVAADAAGGNRAQTVAAELTSTLRALDHFRKKPTMNESVWLGQFLGGHGCPSLP